MTDEKPLHVRVAEALGWTQIVPGGIMLPGCRMGYPPEQQIIGEKEQVPWFERDWSATGPLIEKYSIDIARTWKAIEEDIPGDHWIARIRDTKRGFADGPTPLVAVCNLILKLHEAGKLRAA